MMMRYPTVAMRELAVQAGFHLSVCHFKGELHVHLVIPNYPYPYPPLYSQNEVVALVDFLAGDDVGILPQSAGKIVRIMLREHALGVILPLDRNSSFVIDPAGWEEAYHQGYCRILDVRGEPLQCQYLLWYKRPLAGIRGFSSPATPMAIPFSINGRRITPIIKFPHPRH